MIYGERIRLARELAALTQTELAREVGTTQPAISSLEKDLSQPSDEVIASIAVATHFPVAYFERFPSIEPPEGSLRFRARLSLTAKDRHQARRCGQTIHEHAALMRQALEVPVVTVPDLSGYDPRVAAREARAAFGIPRSGPVTTLMPRLEEAGVLILGLPLAAGRHDAFAFWHRDALDPHPVIAVLSGAPGDRLRFSTSHELAHLVLHRGDEIRVNARLAEDQADTFASEFLAPADDMADEIPYGPTLRTLMLMKRRWGVSLQFLIRRGREVGAIDDLRYTSLFKQLASRGWTKQQPVPISPEHPRAYRKMAELVYGKPVDVGRISREMSWLPTFAADVLHQHAEASGAPAAHQPANVIALGSRRKRN